MLRYKRQIQTALVPFILYISYNIRNKYKFQTQLNQQQATLLEKYKFLKAQIPFDSKSLNTKQNFIPQTLLNTVYPKLKTRNQMMENIKSRKYDLIIVGSTPLAALTLLQASNRGLDAALISQSDFGSYSQKSKQNQLYFNNVEALDSGKEIFFKALLFRYGALSFNMMKHAFKLNKSQYELKDLAPRSVKEVKYNHYYSAEIGIFSRIKQNTKNFIWNFFSILHSVSWITDAGVSYAQKCDDKKQKSQKNDVKEQKNLFNQIDSTYGLRKARFKSKLMEVDWNRVTRDALITASIKDFFFKDKREADYLSNISFKEMILDDRSGNIQNVIAYDCQNKQNFKIKTRAVIDFRNRNPQATVNFQENELKSVGVYQNKQNKEIIKNINSENYYFCIQTPKSYSFFKNPMFFKWYSFSKYQKRTKSYVKQENQIQYCLKINNAKLHDRTIQKFISNQDRIRDTILNNQKYPSSALVQHQYNNQQGQINSTLLKFRKSKYMISLKIAEKLNQIFKFFSSKMFGVQSSYSSIEKPYKFNYEYKSDQKGNLIQISGGNPNFVIDNSKEIIQRLLNEQNFRGTAFSINQSCHSVGQYVLNGSYSAPSVAAFDNSPGTSMLKIEEFKEEIQSKYLIDDQMFYHLFYSYGYTGTLKIIDIGMQMNQFSKDSQGEIIQSQKYPFSAAQIVYLIKYQQLMSLKDLFFNRWGLQLEPVSQVNELIGQLEKNKKQFRQLKKIFRDNQIQEVQKQMLQRQGELEDGLLKPSI